jgi:hypothetical protein
MKVKPTQPYPERNTPTWVIRGLDVSYKDMVFFLKRACADAQRYDSPRNRAYWRTIKAVETLHKRGFKTFRSDKVLDLLIQAAREEGWY